METILSYLFRIELSKTSREPASLCANGSENLGGLDDIPSDHVENHSCARKTKGWREG
jgi:hypothetical protein